MKVSELKEITDALARFATPREKASGPESIIGVQKTGDTLKLISGQRTAAMVVTVGEHDSQDLDYKFTIPARPLLQAAKVLPARATITLRTDKKGLHIQAEGGGVFDVTATDLPLHEAGFPKKPKDFKASGGIDAKNLKRIAKLFKSISAKVEVPSVRVVNGMGYATAVAPGNRPAYANFRFPATSEEKDYNMAAYRDFWDALTHFKDDGVMSWGRAGVLVQSGNQECYSAPYLVSRWDSKTRTAHPPEEQVPWPIMVATKKADVVFTPERKKFIDAVKGQAPFDEHNRVTFEVNTDLLRVTPFGSSDGMDIPCEATGRGIRSVNADYLLALLNALDSKEVTLRWSGGVPAISLSAEDYSSWTILLAPIPL